MARLLGIELFVLLSLGVAIGVLGFMYWDAKNVLSRMNVVSRLTRNNRELHRRIEESISRSKVFEYEKNLVESDLKMLKKDHSKLASQLVRLPPNCRYMICCLHAIIIVGIRLKPKVTWKQRGEERKESLIQLKCKVFQLANY